MNLLEPIVHIAISPQAELRDFCYIKKEPDNKNSRNDNSASRIDEIDDLVNASLPLEASFTGILNSSAIAKMTKNHSRSLNQKTKTVKTVNMSIVMLKERQDELSVRKVTSVNPYKSYWLRCITNCLEADDCFEQQDPGYYIVQPFKDKLHQAVETDEDRLTLKVELDIESEAKRLAEFSSKSNKILIDL